MEAARAAAAAGYRQPVIASPPDATRTLSACAWCEQPLSRPALHSPWPQRCEHCGTRTALALPLQSDDKRRAQPARGPHRICTLGEAARRSARRRMASRIARVAPPGPVLDVGSGDGMLLDALRATGRLTTGIAGRAGGGSRAPRSGIRDAEITELGGRYAAIVFWQSLGRLHAPATALDHAAALLKPGGLLAIAQPTPTRVQARALGERIVTPAAPRERVQIPPQALVERLRALGLQVDRFDHLLDRHTPGGLLHSLLGGVIAIEARR